MLMLSYLFMGSFHESRIALLKQTSKSVSYLVAHERPLQTLTVLGVIMTEGYYWIQDGKKNPEIWLYLLQYGWLRPGSYLPVTITSFRLRGISIISERLIPPQSPA